MNNLRALMYADVRTLINNIRQIRRSPVRAIFWLLWIVFIGGFIVIRFAGPHMMTPGPAPLIDLVRGDWYVAIFAITLGIVIAAGGSFVGLFANAAEARWIIGSPVPPALAVVYIQLRETIKRGLRQLIGFVYFFFIFLPRAISPGAIIRDALFAVLAAIAIGAIPLPRRLATRTWGNLAIAVGIIVGVVGALPALRDLTFGSSDPRIVALGERLPLWHPGIVLIEPPNLESLAVLAGLAAITIAACTLLAIVAPKSYPEIYALSMGRIHRFEQMRQRRSGIVAMSARTKTTVANVPTDQRPRRVPGGAPVIVWRSWVEFQRRYSAGRTAFEVFILLAVGFAGGHFIGDALGIYGGIAAMCINLLILGSVGYGILLAGEIRKPLFRLSSTTFFERVAALLFAQSWHLCAWFVFGGIGAALGGAPPLIVGAIIVGGPCIVLLVAAIGYTCYALVPNITDQRGPMLLVRIFASYLFVVPVAGMGVAAGVIMHDATIGIATAALVAIAESTILLAFVAWRLEAAPAIAS